MAACSTPPAPDHLQLRPVAFADLPGWRDDRIAEALPALQRSCAQLAEKPDNHVMRLGGRAADWRQPCTALSALAAGDENGVRTALQTWFTPYAASNNGGETGLFTGYYEPELHGALVPDAIYRVPLYRKPDDLVMVDLGAFRPALAGQRIAGLVRNGHLLPYPTRADIADGALAGRGLELLYVDDAVDAFFLEIQGSGRVVLPDGRVLRLGYDGQNGHPYVIIGKELLARGALAPGSVTMPTIRAWLAAHPDERQDILNLNPSYVFFRVLPGDVDGPPGAAGLPLTPGRSLAVDPQFLSYGLPVWLDAQDPLDTTQRLQRLMVAQDTGGAIRGPVRGDVFWGHGKEAEARAGVMKSSGRYFILLPQSVSPL